MPGLCRAFNEGYFMLDFEERNEEIHEFTSSDTDLSIDVKLYGDKFIVLIDIIQLRRGIGYTCEDVNKLWDTFRNHRWIGSKGEISNENCVKILKYCLSEAVYMGSPQEATRKKKPFKGTLCCVAKAKGRHDNFTVIYDIDTYVLCNTKGKIVSCFRSHDIIDYKIENLETFLV